VVTQIARIHSSYGDGQQLLVADATLEQRSHFLNDVGGRVRACHAGEGSKSGIDLQMLLKRASWISEQIIKVTTISLSRIDTNVYPMAVYVTADGNLLSFRPDNPRTRFDDDLAVLARWAYTTFMPNKWITPRILNPYIRSRYHRDPDVDEITRITSSLRS